MDVADLIASFADGAPSVTVTRRQRATDDGHGRVVPDPAPTTFQIVARPRPATGRDLLRLPEGRRTVETRVFDTVTQLYAGGEFEPFEADLVDVDGNGTLWECQQVQTWPVAVNEQLSYTVIAQRPAVGR